MPTSFVKNYQEYPARIKKTRKKQLFDFYNANFHLSQWSYDYFDKVLGDKEKRKMLCLVLEKKSRILGFVLGRATGNITNRYNIATLLIDSGQRGKKYGQLLLKEFIKIIKKDKKVKKVYLHFRDSNNLEGFYENCGFGKHRITGHYSNGEKKHYMEILLR